MKSCAVYDSDLLGAPFVGEEKETPQFKPIRFLATDLLDAASLKCDCQLLQMLASVDLSIL